jgi:two-component system NarL family response regulator
MYQGRGAASVAPAAHERETLMSTRASAAVRIRVLVVEDNFYTRYGTVAFLREQADIDVVGAAGNYGQACALAHNVQPDVVLVDLRLPDLDGVQLAEWLIARRPDARILVLTNYQGDEDIFRALRAGARGYLTKDSSGDELLSAIRALHAGDRFIPSAIAERITQRQGRQELTRREREVLLQVADGASNREVAANLGISERTVEVFMSSILSKFGARSRTEAVSIAAHRGLLPTPS